MTKELRWDVIELSSSESLQVLQDDHSLGVQLTAKSV